MTDTGSKRQHHCDANVVEANGNHRRCYAVPAPHKVSRKSESPLFYCEQHNPDTGSKAQAERCYGGRNGWQTCTTCGGRIHDRECTTPRKAGRDCPGCLPGDVAFICERVSR